MRHYREFQRRALPLDGEALEFSEIDIRDIVAEIERTTPVASEGKTR